METKKNNTMAIAAIAVGISAAILVKDSEVPTPVKKFISGVKGKVKTAMNNLHIPCKVVYEIDIPRAKALAELHEEVVSNRRMMLYNVEKDIKEIRDNGNVDDLALMCTRVHIDVFRKQISDIPWDVKDDLDGIYGDIDESQKAIEKMSTKLKGVENEMLDAAEAAATEEEKEA